MKIGDLEIGTCVCMYTCIQTYLLVEDESSNPLSDVLCGDDGGLRRHDNTMKT